MPFSCQYPRPAVAVDCVVFGFDETDLKLLLIQRREEPFRGRWALPGGFVRMAETIEDAARRELVEEAGISRIYLEQLYTFGAVDRDPRERVVSVVYHALVKLGDHHVKASTDAHQAAWLEVSCLPELAFDHEGIVSVALRRLKAKVRYAPIGFELLRAKFTLTQLQRLYEAIFEKLLDKRNFRKKILSLKVLVALDEFQEDIGRRAARFYRFDERNNRKLEKQGSNLEL